MRATAVRLSLRAFDYVQGFDDWIYLVKAVVAGTETVVAKAFYSPARPARKKCKHELPRDVALPSAMPALCAGYMDYVLSSDQIKSVFRRDAIQLNGKNTESETVNRIVQTMTRLGVECYLFGSRRLGFDRVDSDWDILLVSARNPSLLLEHIRSAAGHDARFFSESECNARGRRYARQPGGLDEHVLARLFRHTTPYLQCSEGEIGVFFAHGDDTLVHHDLGELAHQPRHRLRGVVLPNQGDSFRLPRRVLLRDSRSRIHSIESLLWELGGVEQCIGVQLAFSGLARLGTSSWWMGGPAAALEIVA